MMAPYVAVQRLHDAYYHYYYALTKATGVRVTQAQRHSLFSLHVFCYSLINPS
jgi:hypothetical protein